MKRHTALFIVLLIMALPLFAQGQQMEGPSGMAGMIGGIVEISDLSEARMGAESGPAVLFFHAAWCPSCRSARRQIESRASELGDITVYIVDYDENGDLKKKYGVTYQHTFVQIDGNGEKLTLWNGGGVEALLTNVIRDDGKGMN